MRAMPNKSLDVRAKQRLCYLACLFNLKLREFGFAPRQLNRYLSRAVFALRPNRLFLFLPYSKQNVLNCLGIQLKFSH